MLIHSIVNIQKDDIIVLVGLILLNKINILLGCEILALGRFQEHKILSLLGKLLVGEDTILDEHLQVVPLLLIIRTHSVEELLQTVSHLTSDIARNLLYI